MKTVPPAIRPPRDAAGQALIELAFMIVILITIVLAIFEITVIYYNNLVVTNAIHQATWAAANGAQDTEIKTTIYNKLKEMLVTGYMLHDFSEPRIRVYNRENPDYPDVAPGPDWTCDELVYSPQKAGSAAYAFRTEGYQIQVTMDYRIGVSLPFISYSNVVEFPIIEEERIMAQNDLDRDGLVDAYEQEWYGAVYSATWIPLSHGDDGQSDITAGDSDADGDGIVDDQDSTKTSGEWWMYAKYDRDNDGLEDKYDLNWGRHPSRLHQHD